MARGIGLLQSVLGSVSNEVVLNGVVPIGLTSGGLWNSPVRDRARLFSRYAVEFGHRLIGEVRFELAVLDLGALGNLRGCRSFENFVPAIASLSRASLGFERLRRD
jgi:hypothetical protein